MEEAEEVEEVEEEEEVVVLVVVVVVEVVGSIRKRLAFLSTEASGFSLSASSTLQGKKKTKKNKRGKK